METTKLIYKDKCKCGHCNSGYYIMYPMEEDVKELFINIYKHNIQKIEEIIDTNPEIIGKHYAGYNILLFISLFPKDYIYIAGKFLNLNKDDCDTFVNITEDETLEIAKLIVNKSKQYSIKLNFDYESESTYGTPFFLAIKKGYFNLANYYFENDSTINLNIEDSDGYNLLVDCLYYKNYDMFEFLLKNKVNAYKQDAEGRNIMYFVIWSMENINDNKFYDCLIKYTGVKILTTKNKKFYKKNFGKGL